MNSSLETLSRRVGIPVFEFKKALGIPLKEVERATGLEDARRIWQKALARSGEEKQAAADQWEQFALIALDEASTAREIERVYSVSPRNVQDVIFIKWVGACTTIPDVQELIRKRFSPAGGPLGCLQNPCGAVALRRIHELHEAEELVAR